MKNSILLTVFLAIAISLINCGKPAEPGYQTLKGATIFDGNGNSIPNGIIVIKDGKIEAVGDESTPIPGNSATIDLSGKFITPGLIDAHVHFFQTGFFDSRPDALDIRDSINYEELQDFVSTNPEPYFESYLRSGVTAVYDVGGFPWSLELPKLAENNLNAPHVAASGPLLTPVPAERIVTFNTSKDTVMYSIISSEQGKKVVNNNHALGATGIKIWSLNLKDSTFMTNLQSVKTEIDRLGNKMIVHATNLDQATEALRLGAKVLVHSIDDTIVTNEFIALAKGQNVIYCPTLIVSRGYYNAYRALKYGFQFEDPNDVVDERTKGLLNASTRFMKYWSSEQYDIDEYLKRTDSYLKEREQIRATNLKLLYDAGITIAVATDAGNPGTLHGISIYPEMNAMEEAGVTPLDILTMATKNGALAMDRLDDLGTLEKGKIADLIVLEKDPSQTIENMRSISHVMRSGLMRPVMEEFAD
ncbi:amidohydrolase family protein [Eudoraea adriatica]|uniref:amidohydrolase family protein n=1 Tax=Eudoraea adriatica TaxID=446681 RepID=UPI00037A6A7D|nr:amidohydrolase family protein [Eudoraea adriatica]